MITKLNYKLFNGFIHNWLVAGPLAIPRPATNQISNEDLRITEPPVDLGSLGPITQEHPLITWRYYHCRDDHFVDFTAFYTLPQELHAWAYAQFTVPTAQEASLLLTSSSPAELYLDGEQIWKKECFRRESGKQVTAFSARLPAHLQAGEHEILVKFEDHGLRATPYRIALQVQGIPDELVEIHIPTEMEENQLEKRRVLEELADLAYLDRYVYGSFEGDRYDRNEPILLRFPNEMPVYGELTHRLQSLNGDIFQEGTKLRQDGSVFELARQFPIRNGPHHLALLPPVGDYYIKKVCFERHELFHFVRTRYSSQPYGSLEQRKKEALDDASKRRNDSLYCEIAKVVLKMENVDRKLIRQAVDRVDRREDGRVIDLLGILGWLLRFKKKDYDLDDIKFAFRRCILGYRYWEDQPGSDGMDFASESRQILYHTCEILAGQLYPERKFENTGKLGSWHWEHGETLAIDWLRQRGLYGFQAWDSPASFELILAALSYLVDLAQSEIVADLSAVLMDKLFFTLGVNSFLGAFGSTRGQSDTISALSARLEPTSGISRLMWGLGNFNESVVGTVSLACCQKYELPEIVHQIAADTPDAFWNKEHHGDPAGGVNKVTYKSKDFMLCSAQDYHKGEKSSPVHTWQATLGPDALVYVNHPSNMGELDAYLPNLWAGNDRLPRVAQWGDVLIAIHKLEAEDWLGYTHAYFPTACFDEYKIDGKWAFARKGTGYLALSAAQGFDLITSGNTAYRELRSFGRQNTWICQMGQELLDGSFEDFQQKVLALPMTLSPLSAQLTSLRGETLSFDWEGPFLMNDQAQPLAGFNHYENIYCTAELGTGQMDIIYQSEGMRLKFD